MTDCTILQVGMLVFVTVFAIGLAILAVLLLVYAGLCLTIEVADRLKRRLK